MKRRPFGYFAFLCIINLFLGSGSNPSVAQDWKVTPNKAAVLDFPQNARQGHEGNRISAIEVVGDWVIVVIERSTVGPPILVPFVWDIPTVNDRFANVIAHNRISGEWRTLQFPNDYFIETTDLRVSNGQSETVRFGVSFSRGHEQLCQFADWTVSSNELVVSKPEIDYAADSIARFFSQPPNHKDNPFLTAGSRHWNLLENARWDINNVPCDKDFFTYFEKSKLYLLFQVSRNEDFHIRQIVGIENYPGESISSRAKLEQTFGGRIAQAVLADSGTACDLQFAIIRLETGRTHCVSIEGTVESIYDFGTESLMFNEIGDVSKSNSGQYVAVYGIIPGNNGDEDEGLEKLVVFRVDRKENGIAVSSIWKLDLDVEGASFAGIGDKGELFFSSGRSIFVWTHLGKSTLIAIDDALEIEFVGSGN